jgi:hypothetical protein
MLHNAGLPIAKYLTPLDMQMGRNDGKLVSNMTRPIKLKVCPKIESMHVSIYSLVCQYVKCWRRKSCTTPSIVTSAALEPSKAIITL